LCRQAFPVGFSVQTAPENTLITEQVKEKHPQEYQERAEEWNREQEELRHVLVKKVKLGNEHAAVNVSHLLPPFFFFIEKKHEEGAKKLDRMGNS